MQPSLSSAEWCLKRNCSASPKQLALIYGSLVAVSFGIAIGFAMLGLWGVLPFAGIELLGLAAAFVVYGRHAGDYERVVLHEERLRIERCSAGALSVEEFGAPWVRVRRERSMRPRVWLEVRGRQVEIGRYVGVERREAFAEELQRALRPAGRGASDE